MPKVEPKLLLELVVMMMAMIMAMVMMAMPMVMVLAMMMMMTMTRKVWWQVLMASQYPGSELLQAAAAG